MTANAELSAANTELRSSNELEKLAIDPQEQLRRSEEQRRMYGGAISEMPAPLAIVSSSCPAFEQRTFFECKVRRGAMRCRRSPRSRLFGATIGS